ncbi:hypothetical protein FA15DRAFT_702381 [Coprinopsis marcescibilis]|uniref:DUF6533 domain-containing protein n=1 Tax=Coprinopsis marcescibilis TaxID=230819 RepID=A0A5C3L1W4_COPMA|nr:hypothetical protein FA15DRAFT_702381 [Coprinopsis marcescibilis]
MDSGLVGDDVQGLLAQALWRAQLSNFIAVGFYIIMLLELFENLPLEVDLIWVSKSSFVKFTYFLTRYVGLLYMSISIVYQLEPTIPEKAFKSLFASLALGAIHVLGAEGLLYFQVLAISTNGRFVKVFLIAQFLALLVFSIVSNTKIFLDTKYIVNPLLTAPICVPIGFPFIWSGIVFAVLCVNQISLILTTLIVAYRKYTSLRSTLLTVLLKNGFAYWCIILVINGVITISGLLEWTDVYFALMTPMLVAQNLLSTRGILAIREAARGESMDSIQLGSMQFAPGVTSSQIQD